MTAALIGAAAAIHFSGTVPPHQASNGLIFSLSDAEQSEIMASLKACRISDYSAAGAQAYQFAVTDTRDADCVRAQLPASARIAAKTSWSN